MPQNKRSHTKDKLRDILSALFERQKGARADPKFHGKLSSASKMTLAQRLADRLQEVIDEGCQAEGSSDNDDEFGSDSATSLGDDDDGGPRGGQQFRAKRSRPVEQIGEVPHDAAISAAQAESALGRNLATEWDDDDLEHVDADQRAEEERLIGRVIHPQTAEVDYNLLCWSPVPDDLDHAAGLIDADHMGWPSDLPKRRLSRADFQFDRDSVARKLEQSVSALEQSCAKQISSASWRQQLEDDVRRLDPTQKLLYDHVTSWARAKKEWLHNCRINLDEVENPPVPCQVLLLGTAGTGKTHVAKLAIQESRRIFGSFSSVLTVAHSGVAAANLGGGARTIDSIFHTNKESAAEDAIGEQLDELVAQLGDVELLVIDEISTVGAAQLGIMDRRLRQVARVLYRRRFNSDPPSDMGLFGGIGVVLMGDFAQLPPVLATCLLHGSVIVERHNSGLRPLAFEGQKVFAQFTKVLRFRRIHRQKGVDPFKESTMRLRDAAITVEDYQLWKEHEIECIDPSVSESVPWQGGEQLLTTGLTLVATNKQSGVVNGSRLASAAPIRNQSVPDVRLGPLPSARVIVRVEARHTHPKGEARKSDEFRNIRKSIHIRVGAKVTLGVNFLWGVSTVALGLMNGARGVIVAIAYAQSGANRVDSMQLAGTGFPKMTNNRFPRGPDQCPIPDFVVVNFPEYTGLALIPGLPRTWVPIAAEQVACDNNKRLIRVQVPLRLAWALTFHKCQGITAPEGTIISFRGCDMHNAVSQPGLPFVGWTRATSWSKVAFECLPPLTEFLAVRLHQSFGHRTRFERHADELHDAFLVQLGTSHDQQVKDHQQHLSEMLLCREGRSATPEELADIADMLGKRGVAPISNSVQESLSSTRAGKKAGGGLMTLVAALKGSKKVRDVADEKLRDKRRRTLSMNRCDKGSSVQQEVLTSLLKEYGHAEHDIAQAVRDRGSSLMKCQAYLDHLKTGQSLTAEWLDDNVTEGEWAKNVILDLGFDDRDITEALETTSYCYPEALALLIYGDWYSTRLTRQLKRHVSKANVPCAPFQDKLSHYATKAHQELNISVEAIDLGTRAGHSINACFWLSLAAGLTRCGCRRNSRVRDLPSFHAAVNAAIPSNVTQIQDSELGNLALELRTHMCFGAECAMLKPEIRDDIYQAFAVLGSSGPTRTLELYKAWVSRLAATEFADELVVLATALWLKVRIVIVPWNDPLQSTWKISTYPPPQKRTNMWPTVYLGNEDVHYVWLKQR